MSKTMPVQQPPANISTLPNHWSASAWLATTVASIGTHTLTATTNSPSLNYLLTEQQTTLNNLNATSMLTTPASGSSSSSGESNESNDLIHNKIVQIFFCILYTTVFVLGVFGNVLVCYVVLRNRAMQTVTNIFITNLALSDILLCVLAVPFTPLYTFMGRWAFGRTLCHLVSFAQGCSIYISTLTLTSIAVDRYLVIIYPFHPRMKLSTCIIIIISIWVVAVLATLPYGMYMKVVSEALLNGNGTTTEEVDFTALSRYELQPRHHAAASNWSSRNNYSVAPSTAAYMQVMQASVSAEAAAAENAALANTAYCEENWPSEHYRKIFGSLTTIFQFVLPFVIISICYIWVSIKLNARARAKPGSKSSRREEADRDRKKRTNRMLISMVAVFGLSWLPINLVNIFDDFYEKSNEWRFYTLFFFVAHSIAMSSTCYNPFLYAWLNENFRKEFKHVLPCFNPSNNNIINITRSYNRSERNTCGPRLHNGAGGGSGNAGGACTDFDDLDENGVTQETCLPKEKLLIIPREATYGNGNSSGGCQQLVGAVTSPGCGSGVGNSSTMMMHGKRIDILLNDTELTRSRRCRGDDNIDDSGEEEQTVEMRFVETPFVSSDNATGISLMMETSTSTSNEVMRSNTTLDVERVGGRGSN